MHSRGRDVERLRRVSEADAIHAECINCPATACSWREVKGPNSRHVLAGHKRACCFFAGQYEPTGSGSAVDFGTFCDGVREEDDGSIADMDGSVVVHEDLHEDYIIQRTVQGTVPVVEKKKHQERMRILDNIKDYERKEFALPTVANEDMDFEAPSSFTGDIDGIVKAASTHVYDHQMQIENILSNPLPDMRRTKDPKTKMLVNKDPTATIALLDLGFAMNISDHNGDLLLAYLKEYSTGVFFTKWSGIKDSFNRQFKNVCKLQQYDIPLPPEFFGAVDNEGEPLKPVSCFFYNILLRLGEACLEINPDDFTSNYTDCDRMKDTNERIFNTFPKAKLFQRFTLWIESTHGEKAACIVVAIYFDAALATSSRSFCPLIMFILNCTGKSFRPIFIGYCPIDLAYTDESLTKILHRQSSKVKKPPKRSCKYAIRYAKRHALHQFLVHVLSPISDSYVHGLKLQIGSDKTQKKCIPIVIYAVINLGNFLGDSAALHDLASVKIGCKECRCRVCTCSNLACFGKKNRDFSVRSSELMYALTYKLGEIELDKFQRSCGVELDPISQKEKELRATCERLSKRLGIIGGGNPVIALWRRPEAANVFSFYLALVLDYLHTLWKGICEFAASGVLQIIHCISKNYAKLELNSQYQYGKANLDERLSRWNGLKESFHPVRLVHLEKVTDLLKADAKDQKGKERTTGVIRGCFPAWQMPNLCLQLIFGIGCEGSIIPNQNILISEDVVRRYGNPTTICLQALSGVLEVAFFCEANSLRESQLEIMADRIDSACFNLFDLHDFKMKLFQRTMAPKPVKLKSASDAPKTVAPPIKPNKYEFPRNVKTHSTSHFPRQIRLFGAFSGSINSSLGEASHKMNVTQAFGRSSTLIATSTAEMARHTLRKELVVRQMQCLRNRKIVEPDDLEPELVLEDEELIPDGNNNTDSLCFHAVVQHGSVDLRGTQNDDMLEPVANPTEGDKFMHPLLERKELWALLVKASLTDAWIKTVMREWLVLESRKNDRFKIRLYGGVKCDGHADAGVAPFILRATKEYRGNAEHRARPSPVFNSCEISYQNDEFAFGKILALVGFQGLSTAFPQVLQCRLWVVVARYVQEIVTDKIFPFNTFKFECDARGRLSLDFVEVQSIHRPCFMTISSDANKDFRFETTRNYKDMRWFCIPFDRAVKTENVAYEDSTTMSFATDVEVDAKLIELGMPEKCEMLISGTASLGVRQLLGVVDEGDVDQDVEDEAGNDDSSESEDAAEQFVWDSDGES